MKSFLSNKKLEKTNVALIVLSTMLLISMTLLLCFIGSGIKGKDGENGRNANVKIDDHDQLIINDDPTGIYAKKGECEVLLSVEGEEYGRVVGGGKFKKGQTVAIQAIPNEDACFVGWKNQNNEIISSNTKHAFIVEDKKTEFTAVFEKSEIEVNFKTSEVFSYYFKNRQISLQLNDVEQSLKMIRDTYGNKYYTLSSPAIYNYGETITMSLEGFEEPSCEYKIFLYQLNENEFNNNASSSSKRIDLTNNLKYTFNINENKKYFFRLDIELNILVSRVPTIDITPNNETYGSVSKTDCSNLGDSVTILATPLDSGTLDYIYEFDGWYLDDELVSKEASYTFTTKKYYYNYVAKFIKKYALKLSMSLGEKPFILNSSDKTAYDVVFKSLSVHAIDKNGVFHSADFNGNYGGSEIDKETKICGYFEEKEAIYLSYEIESAHASYYVTDSKGNKTYKEKYVYARWQVFSNGSFKNFANSSSSVYKIIEENGTFNCSINLELYVLHYGQSVGD